MSMGGLERPSLGRHLDGSDARWKMRGEHEPVFFELILTRTGNHTKPTQLVCDCGPGDDGKPVITIGFSEDF
jgi:hypothetical protein